MTCLGSILAGLAFLAVVLMPRPASAVEPVALPAGCDLPEVEQAFQDFVTGVNRRDRSLVLSRIAPRPWLRNGFGISFMRRDGSVSSNWGSRRPLKIYRYFVRLRKQGWRFSFLGSNVGAFVSTNTSGRGPWQVPDGVDARNRAVPFSFVIGMKKGRSTFRQMGGKGGMNCPQGRFFQWAGGIERGAKPAYVCSGRPEVSPRRPERPPTLCRRPSGAS